MKDLNELMQSILNMDAAQRKATADALNERAAKQEELKKQEQAIADELAAKAQAEGKAAAAQAEADNKAAFAKLEADAKAAADKLEAAVAANRAAWVDALYKQALGLADADEVKTNAAAQ